MILSTDQLRSLEQGESVPIKIDDKECVVVPKEVFERMQQPANIDTLDTYASVLQAIDSDDEDTNQYLDYLKQS